jgi:small subunit ribosomal protein S1
MEEGIDGLLHVSDMSWTRKISHASEMLEKGHEVECVVVSVDQTASGSPWDSSSLTRIPGNPGSPNSYQPGSIVTGTVTKITNFGVFVQLEDELEGLLHVSELTGGDASKNPEEIVKVGDQVEVKILRVDTNERKIGLSMKLDAELEPEAAAAGDASKELKGGMGDSSGPLFSMNHVRAEESEKSAAEE